ncbi:hypothetical protein [Streptomyces griseorubiginosus]|uniref:hypothetical protein n=1 Tax=Streptomyces griseorubiginosus TaxID=67304 RepID=UPI0036E9AF13
MTNPPRPTHTHRLGRSPLPAWLDGLHRRDAGELVVHTPDGDARPRPGWTVVAWSDGTVTVASPTTAARVYGPGGVYAQLEQAEAAIARVTELHPPADDWSWATFGCDHGGAHWQLCARCRTCHPCQTTRALVEEPTP